MTLKTATLPFRYSRCGKYILANDHGKDREIIQLYPCVDQDGHDCEEMRSNHAFLFMYSKQMFDLVKLLDQKHNAGECLDPEIHSTVSKILRKREEFEKSRL